MPDDLIVIVHHSVRPVKEPELDDPLFEPFYRLPEYTAHHGEQAGGANLRDSNPHPRPDVEVVSPGPQPAEDGMRSGVQLPVVRDEREIEIEVDIQRAGCMRTGRLPFSPLLSSDEDAWSQSGTGWRAVRV